MRSRLLVLGGGALLAAACAFPELQYGDGGGGGDDASTVDVRAGDGGAVAEGATDAEAAVADAGDAPVTGDGGDQPESGAEAGPVCDQDNDNHHAEGGTCGGDDCCDISFDTHPGQTAFFNVANACHSFDYDCSGKEEPQYPSNIKCGGTGALGCTGGPGYITDPGCGQSGLFYTCVGNGALACQPGQPTSVRQQCH